MRTFRWNRGRRSAFHVCWTIYFLASVVSVCAQPRSGDVFREYRWTNTGGDAGGALRVGGRVGYDGKPIALDESFDLEHALRAEVVIEKLLCHDGTRGLAISLNDHPWIVVPESDGIPHPAWEYQHHTYPVLPIPLAQLRAGERNQFRLQVAEEHSWDWPQHLIYGVHFRIYYDPDKKPHPEGRVVAPQATSAVGRQVVLKVETESRQAAVRRVDFIGLYEDVNLEGDGDYRQWHYHYRQSRLAGHLGTAHQAPWQVDWDTSWVPDQQQPLEIAAWITDATNVTYQTPSVSGLTFARDGLTVELCKPFDVPRKWVTRSDEHGEKLRVTGDLNRAIAARLVWSSWSPGYMAGVFINGHQILDCEGPRYASFLHRVPLPNLSVLKPGENLLTTGKTPLHNGQMVHGMEVNWSGIMLLIQYQE